MKFYENQPSGNGMHTHGLTDRKGKASMLIHLKLLHVANRSAHVCCRSVCDTWPINVNEYRKVVIKLTEWELPYYILLGL
jgi:hypothetical protein